MAIYEDPTKKKSTALASQNAAPDGYTQEVQNSLGMRLLRRELPFQQRADAAQANVGAEMARQRATVVPAAAQPAAAPAAPAPALMARRPQVLFAGTDAPPPTMFRNSPPAQRTPAQLNAASAAEVAARNKASPASSSPGVGAPAATGGGSASGYFVGSNGVRRTINADGSIAGSGTAATTVNRQSMGGVAPALTRSQPVASTFGLPVTDPRMNDQRAAPPRPSGILRGPDAMAEHYAAGEDRAARQKLLSDLDSQRFRQELIQQHGGRQGRAATAALGDIAAQQAGLVNSAAAQSAEALQGRQSRANVLANTGLEQAGADRRAELADATAREGQQLNYRSDMARTGADIVRPQLLQDADGNYISVAGGRGDAVTRADGTPVRGLVSTTRNFQQEADDKLLSDLIANQVDAAGAPLPNAVELAQQQFAAIRKGAGAAAQTGKPTWEQFKAANPGGDEAKLRAYYTQNYGN